METIYLILVALSALGAAVLPVLSGWASDGNGGKAAVPKIEPYNEKMSQKLKEMKIGRGAAYKPRTKHLFPDGSPKYTTTDIINKAQEIMGEYD